VRLSCSQRLYTLMDTEAQVCSSKGHQGGSVDRQCQPSFCLIKFWNPLSQSIRLHLSVLVLYCAGQGESSLSYTASDVCLLLLDWFWPLISRQNLVCGLSNKEMNFQNKGAVLVQIAPLLIRQPRNQNQSQRKRAKWEMLLTGHGWRESDQDRPLIQHAQER